MSSKKSIKGYDLDGVLAGTNKPDRPKPYFKQTGEEREDYHEVERKAYKKANLLRDPIKPYHIITSRHKRYRDVTVEWCEENGLDPKTINLIDRSRSQSNMIDFKIEKAKELGIDIFYEDDKDIAKGLLGNGFRVKWVKII